MCIQTQQLISKRQRSVVQCIVKCCFPLVITISDSVLSPSKFDDIHVFGMHILGRTNVSPPCVIRMSKKHRIYLNDINIQLEKVSGTQNSKNAYSRQTRVRGKEEHEYSKNVVVANKSSVSIVTGFTSCLNLFQGVLRGIR